MWPSGLEGGAVAQLAGLRTASTQLIYADCAWRSEICDLEWSQVLIDSVSAPE
jgi:hypothetical protein